MVLKLYGSPMSTCVKRVVTTLKEKQAPYELVPIDFAKGEHKTPEYLEKHPFGVMPVLEDDGYIVYESRAICRYIEQKYKDQGTPLIPSDVKELGIFEQGASIEHCYFDPNASGLAVEHVFKPLFYGGEPDKERVKQLSEKLAGYFDVYEKILSKQEFIGGNTFTLADVYHLPYGSMLFHPNTNMGHLINDRPLVKAWWEKISGRQSWKEANETSF